MCSHRKMIAGAGVCLLVVSFGLPLAAQEARWEELNGRVMQLGNQGKYADALPLAQEALRVAEESFGPEHPKTATSLNNLAELYRAQGKYGAAEPLFQRTLTILEKALGPEHPGVATSLNNLAELYRVQGKYGAAEPLYQRALVIREKTLGPEHPDVATLLNNLALLYEARGKYRAAEPLYQRALAIQEKALGPEHPDVATSLNNLAVLYEAQGKYGAAEPLKRRALAILEKALGPEDPDVATLLNNLAALYDDQGKYSQAEPLYQRALAIREKVLGPEHPDVATSLNNLAELYWAEGKYGAAVPLYQRALAILEKALGPEHPDVEMSLSNLAVLYEAQDLPTQAEPLFAQGLENLAKQFEDQFTYMSERERLGFLDTVAGAFPIYYSFCLTYRNSNPALIGKMYDVLLWQKGFVGASIAALRTQVAASGDNAALELLDQLTAKKTQLSKLLTAEPADRVAWRKQVEELENEANDLERGLVKRSSALAEEKKLARVTWRDVQAGLGPDEAAVEFVRFQFHNGKRWTGTNYYAALIVTPKSTTAPTFVLLGDAKQLEGAPLMEYQQRVNPRGPPTAVMQGNFYKAFWQPLEPALAGTKRIYLSPDGVLNQISLGVVPMSDGRLLMEKYQLRVVSSTKDILREKRKPETNSAVLIGNPQYDLDEAQQRVALRGLQKQIEPNTLLASASAPAGYGLRSRDTESETLPPLPGTKVEVESIRSLLEKQHWQLETYTGGAALKEVIQRVQHPRVLHVATHGFFLSNQERIRTGISTDRPSGMEDPMLRSGLFFAGANRALAGKQSPPDLEDGVLTAYEATGLNLQGTELVVLSACDTGQGQVKNGEGVFGLQRAFEEAGAQAVLMSMWAVPDRETQELMTLFYTKWLTGEGKSEALREAQLEMRKRVKARYGQDLPYYWGAFVLVGH